MNGIQLAGWEEAETLSNLRDLFIITGVEWFEDTRCMVQQLYAQMMQLD